MHAVLSWCALAMAYGPRFQMRMLHHLKFYLHRNPLFIRKKMFRSSHFLWLHWIIRRCLATFRSGRSRCAVNTCSYDAGCQLVILVSFLPPLVKIRKHLIQIHSPQLKTLQYSKLMLNEQCFLPVRLEKTTQKIYNNVLRHHFTRLVPESQPIRYNTARYSTGTVPCGRVQYKFSVPYVRMDTRHFFRCSSRTYRQTDR
jgi:hypothetical protein